MQSSVFRRALCKLSGFYVVKIDEYERDITFFRRYYLSWLVAGSIIAGYLGFMIQYGNDIPTISVMLISVTLGCLILSTMYWAICPLTPLDVDESTEVYLLLSMHHQRIDDQMWSIDDEAEYQDMKQRFGKKYGFNLQNDSIGTKTMISFVSICTICCGLLGMLLADILIM